MSIGQNIRKLREARGLTQEELARAVGVTRPAVTQWESGWSKPRMGTIEKLATYFGISISELLGEKSTWHPLIPGAQRIVSGGEASMPLVQMPLAGAVHAGEPADEPDADAEVMVPKDVADAHPGGFALHVEGDCMDRVIPDGYDVVVDPSVEPRHRSIVVCRLEETGEVVMRRLAGSRQTMILEADSHSAHDDIVFPADGAPVTLVGVVVWSQKAMRD